MREKGRIARGREENKRNKGIISVVSLRLCIVQINHLSGKYFTMTWV
jgi:hypothetical protein